MKLKKKLSILFFPILLVTIYALFYIKKNIAANISSNAIKQTKLIVNKQIDLTKNYINKEIKKIAQSKKIKKSKILSTAKEIQNNIYETSENIKANIKQVSDQTSPKTKDRIKNIVYNTRQSIRQELKNAYKEIKKLAIEMLKTKKTSSILRHAKNIQITTEKTSKLVKNNINQAFKAIEKSC